VIVLLMFPDGVKWSDLAELTAEPAITDEEAYQVCVEALENRK